jgi:hypothetical protein
VPPVIVGSSKKRGGGGTIHFYFHQSAPYTDLWQNIKRIFTSLYTPIPINCCTHNKYCTKHHEQLNMVDLSMNRLARAPLKCFTYSFNTGLGQCMACQPTILQDTLHLSQMLVPMHHRSVHLIKLVCRTTALPATEYNPLSASWKTTDVKWCETELPNAGHMCLEDHFDQVGGEKKNL